MGNLLAVHVHAANIHDTKGGVYTFEKALYYYPSIKAGCADEGYPSNPPTFSSHYPYGKIKKTASQVIHSAHTVKSSQSFMNRTRFFGSHINILPLA